MSSTFSKFDGFLACRIAKDKTGQKISFIDFDSQKSAADAKESMKGFKFLGHQNRGLNIRISDNSKPNIKNGQGFQGN